VSVERIDVAGDEREKALVVADGFFEPARGALGAPVAPERLDVRGRARGLAHACDGARLQRFSWTRKRARRRRGGGSQCEQRERGAVRKAHRS